MILPFPDSFNFGLYRLSQAAYFRISIWVALSRLPSLIPGLILSESINSGFSSTLCLFDRIWVFSHFLWINNVSVFNTCEDEWFEAALLRTRGYIIESIPAQQDSSFFQFTYHILSFIFLPLVKGPNKVAKFVVFTPTLYFAIISFIVPTLYHLPTFHQLHSCWQCHPPLSTRPTRSVGFEFHKISTKLVGDCFKSYGITFSGPDKPTKWFST